MIIFGGRSVPSESIFKLTKNSQAFTLKANFTPHTSEAQESSAGKAGNRCKKVTPQVFKSRRLPQGCQQACLPESKSYWDDTVEEECIASWYAFLKTFSPLMLVLLHKIYRKWTLPLFINANLQKYRCLVLDFKCIWQENSSCSKHKHRTNTSWRDWTKTEGCIFSLRHPSSSQVLSQSLTLVTKVKSLIS